MSRNWTPQQKNAIYATDGSVLVSAGGGFGQNCRACRAGNKAYYTGEKSP